MLCEVKIKICYLNTTSVVDVIICGGWVGGGGGGYEQLVAHVGLVRNNPSPTFPHLIGSFLSS